eukprot:TRINITY_DN919_c0_g1_i2.p2 TRINITY_DN919_c0_g1~~TRINITY_DN919_c0_g1_i2.p2  ORF type:complete len:120 (-),score=26.36 TRINITY_DN919_c0_g1_i2:447-806(-)
MANRRPNANSSSVFGADSATDDAPHAGKRMGPKEKGDAPFAVGSDYDPNAHWNSVAKADFSKQEYSARQPSGKAVNTGSYNIITGEGSASAADPRGNAGKRAVHGSQQSGYNILTGEPK